MFEPHPLGALDRVLKVVSVPDVERFGVIGIGLTLPLAFNLWMKVSADRKFAYVAVTASFSLIGVFLLRNFILYTGQMTGV